MLSVTRYDHAIKCFHDGTMNWVTDDFKLALVTSAHTLSNAHTVWADVSAHEVATGGGYTTGGLALANKTVTNEGLFADDLLWTALNKTFRYGVIYRVGLVNGLTDPLFCRILWNTNDTDKVINSIDFAAYIPATGLVRFL